MNEIQVFDNQEFGTIRTLTIDNVPYFVGKDVAEALMYSNTRDALAKHVDTSDKATVAIHDGRQNRKMVVINESGFYCLVFSSQLPKAQEFKLWVTKDVLPQIRQTGQYIPAQQPQLSMEEMTLLVIQGLQQQIADKEKEIATKNQTISIMTPKAEFCDSFLQNPVTYTATQIAEHYGWTAQKLNKFLKDNGVQYKQSGQWHIKGQYKTFGYVSYEMLEITSKSGLNPTLHKQEMKWTAKGVAWIERSLRLRGIVPITPFNVDTTLDDEKTF